MEWTRICIFTTLLLFLVVVNAINKNSTSARGTFASRSFSTSTSSSVSSTDNDSNKDQRLFDLLESLMVTIHDKLRRAESLETSCRTMLTTMSRRLDALDNKFEESTDRSEAALAKLRSIDSRIIKEDAGGSQLLRALVTKVDTLSDQLAELKNQVVHDKQADGHFASHDDGEVLSAMGSEHRTIVTDKAGHSVVTVLAGTDHDPKAKVSSGPQTLPKKEAWENSSEVSHGLAYLKERFSDLDIRLQGWMSQVDAKANTIADSVNDLHDALMDPRGLDEVLEETPVNGPGPPNLRGIIRSGRTTATTTTTTTTTTPPPPVSAALRNATINGSNSFGGLRRSTKLDKLIQRIRPILRVGEQMDELWTVVLGTQRSVDDSLQKSDQLLTNSYRQVQTLSDVKNYLHHQTSRIMANLEQVEEWLKEQTAASPTTLDPKVMPINLRDLIERADLQNDDVVLEDIEDFVLPEESPDKLADVSSNGAMERRLLRLREGDYARKTQSLEPKVRVMKLPITAAAASASSIGSSSKKNTTATNATSTNFNGTGGPKDTCPYQETSSINCADLRSRGMTTSGVYYILIKGTTYWFMKVYCEMEIAGGGWTAIQRRDDFGVQKENFIRDWTDYKNGFGDLRKEFWLGNENVFMLTSQDDYTLRVELEDFDGNKRFAMYTKFKLYSEAENYKLEIGGYEGNAGDSFNDPWYGSNLNPFSTYDRDNDRSSLNCASMLRGGWWWRSCGRGLNGIYLTDPTDLAARQGIVWFRWRGWDYTLKKASMLIRPKSFVPPKSG